MGNFSVSEFLNLWCWWGGEVERSVVALDKAGVGIVSFELGGETHGKKGQRREEDQEETEDDRKGKKEAQEREETEMKQKQESSWIS